MPVKRTPASVPHGSVVVSQALTSFADTNFAYRVHPYHTNDYPKDVVLRRTPPSHKEVCIRLQRTIQRFMGDVPDARRQLAKSHQPNYGSVMSRLYKLLGYEQFHPNTTSADHGVKNEGLPSDAEAGKQQHQQHGKAAGKKGGAKAGNVFDSLPLEDTLLTQVEMAQYITGYGILLPTLRDEIYMTVCKQLVRNPYRQSIDRGWLLLHVITSIFLPDSDEVKQVVLKFLDENQPIFTTPIRKSIQRTAENGNRYQPPSKFEYDAIASRAMLEVTVTLMTQESHVLVLDPASCAAEVIAKLAKVIGLKDTAGFGLFITMGDKVSSLGDAGDHVMDSIARCEQLWYDARNDVNDHTPSPWQLYMRRELLPQWPDNPHDSTLMTLTFAQIQRGLVAGEYTCQTDEEWAVLAARLYYVEYGMDISEDDMRDAVSAYIPSTLLHTTPSWLPQALHAHHRLFHSPGGHRPTKQQVKADVIDHARVHWQREWCRHYDVRLLKRGGETAPYVLGVGGAGLSLFAGSTHLRHVTFVDIRSFDVEKVVVDDKLHHIMVVNLLNTVTWRFDSPDAIDACNLATALLRALRKRSTLALVISLPALADGHSSGDLDVGDLVVLCQPAADVALVSPVCDVTKGDKTFTVSTNAIYILPTIRQPAAAALAALKPWLLQSPGEVIHTPPPSHSSDVTRPVPVISTPTPSAPLATIGDVTLQSSPSSPPPPPAPSTAATADDASVTTSTTTLHDAT